MFDEHIIKNFKNFDDIKHINEDDTFIRIYCCENIVEYCKERFMKSHDTINIERKDEYYKYCKEKIIRCNLIYYIIDDNYDDYCYC